MPSPWTAYPSTIEVHATISFSAILSKHLRAKSMLPHFAYMLRTEVPSAVSSEPPASRVLFLIKYP
ncbi:hypothetical protein C4D60_Mb03t05550 [Musa balbisiana]|uniref:Uncharacterized protein n=1 Tax=Musa balbisiana TaxID=52838 RepID=A0A4S8J7T1_MUSBA|nr:hypothetical protein C4D60_Mb03t05550 [Musa balbisiana]